jgi:sphinganine-1-phosphate aldolase
MTNATCAGGIPAKGRSAEEVQGELETFRARDVAWREGKTFAYVFDAGAGIEAVQKRAFAAYMSENGLDPTAFPSLLAMENAVIGMARAHLGGDEDVVGSFTSGGTESLILAIKAARDLARATRPDLKDPQMVIPVSAHAAFHKAGHYLGVEVVTTPIDPVTLRADVAAMRAAVGPRTILLAASASQYAHGVVDPVEEIAALAREHDLPCHVDGCIGGFLLPYLRRLGEPVPAFGFEVPGVTSISMDLHKYAYCAKGASVVLYRNAKLRRHQIYACASWTGYALVNATVQSTKSGGPIAAAWAVMQHVGDDGYLRIAEALLGAKRGLEAAIAATPGLRLLGQPEMPLLAFTSVELDPYAIADELSARGFWVQPQLAFDGIPPSIHLSVTPSNVPHVAEFARALGESVAAVRAEGRTRPDAGDLAPLAVELSRPENLSRIPDMLRMVGIGGEGEMPARRAELNALLDLLPRPVRAQVLTEFASTIFTPRRGAP